MIDIGKRRFLWPGNDPSEKHIFRAISQVGGKVE